MSHPHHLPDPAPIRRVSARKYTRAATVRFRIKGQPDGPIYRGQALLRPCATCPPIHIPIAAPRTL